jgi:hypothetical protein
MKVPQPILLFALSEISLREISFLCCQRNKMNQYVKQKHTVFSVTILKVPCRDSPAPPPITIPSIIATFKYPIAFIKIK